MSTLLTKAEKKAFKQFDLDTIYFEKNNEGFRKRFPDEHVAIYKGKLVGHGYNLNNLMKLLKTKYKQKIISNMVVEYLPAEEIIFILPSVAAA